MLEGISVIVWMGVGVSVGKSKVDAGERVRVEEIVEICIDSGENTVGKIPTSEEEQPHKKLDTIKMRIAFSFI